MRIPLRHRVYLQVGWKNYSNKNRMCNFETFYCILTCKGITHAVFYAVDYSLSFNNCWLIDSKFSDILTCFTLPKSWELEFAILNFWCLC